MIHTKTETGPTKYRDIMKNLEVKKFEAKLKDIKARQIESIERQYNENLAKIESFKFERFTNEMPFEGALENKVFFTYSNHYRGNSGTWMSVNELNPPHLNYEDRGYIKGVVTDLTGYLIIRSAKSIVHNFRETTHLYFPYFRKSKHSEDYKLLCKTLEADILNEIEGIIESKINALSLKVKEITGMSLFYYLRGI